MYANNGRRFWLHTANFLEQGLSIHNIRRQLTAYKQTLVKVLHKKSKRLASQFIKNLTGSAGKQRLEQIEDENENFQEREHTPSDPQSDVTSEVCQQICDQVRRLLFDLLKIQLLEVHFNSDKLLADFFCNFVHVGQRSSRPVWFFGQSVQHCSQVILNDVRVAVLSQVFDKIGRESSRGPFPDAGEGFVVLVATRRGTRTREFPIAVVLLHLECTVSMIRIPMIA